MSKVLLIDDDPQFRSWLFDVLTTQGHIVACAVNGFGGLSYIQTFNPDIIILNLVMPPMDSFELLRVRKCTTPVIMISAQNNEDERIKGYELGADDYLSKPFSIKELIVRLNALERRICPNLKRALSVEEIPIETVVFDEPRYRVNIYHRVVSLTQTEFKLFKYLFEHRGQVITKQELQHSVLQKEFGRFDRNLDMHICNTRRKLNHVNLPRNLINTVRGQGYCLTV